MKVRFRIALFLMLIASCVLSCAPGKKEAAPEAVGTGDSLRRKTGAYLNDCVALKKQAFKMDSLLQLQNELDVKMANTAMGAFTDFAYHCSGDSLSPVYLIKTAQVAQAVNNMPQAKLVLEKCISAYPHFRNRPAAIFLLAQLYDESAYLDNEQQAKVLYQQVIDEYPKSDWAASAKGALKFIGKSDKQIMEELKKKSK